MNHIYYICWWALAQIEDCAQYVLKCSYYAILKAPNLVLKVSYNRFTCIQGQKHFNFPLYTLQHHSVRQCQKRLYKGFSLSKPLLSENLLLWLVRWPSLLWLVYHLLHVGNHTAITISEFQLRMFLSTWYTVKRIVMTVSVLPYQSHPLEVHAGSGFTVQKTRSSHQVDSNYSLTS